MKNTTIYEARRSADWQKGYDEAIEAIRQSIKNGINGSTNRPQDDSDIPGVPMDPSNQQGQGQGQGQQGQGEGRGSGSQGVVQPEDCMSPGSLSNVPGAPGGFVDRKTGDEIAKSEGYEKEGGSDSQTDKEWEDRAMTTAKKMAGMGKGFAKFASKLMDIYKSKADWKKELRKVVGRCISEEDKRRGYTSNNILVSQDRIALTDKQKFDNLDYLLICLDTSGSFFGGEEMKQALREVAQVALTKKPMRIYVVYWDTRVASIEEYTSVQALVKAIKTGKTQPKGGGGTDVQCVWDMLKTDKRFKRIRPELTVIFTDGYLNGTPKRDARRMQHLVWCIIDNPNFSAPPDALTRTIHMKMSD